MTPFRRQEEPTFWGAHERRWLYETTASSSRPLHDWKHRATPQEQAHPLAFWFHALVRAEGEPRRCAYCDGPLGTESPDTIDHFIPQSRCRELAVSWDNLYPACVQCNTTFKRMQWSCRLVRPDRDPVEEWFDFDEVTGRLAPAPELDRRTRARVRLTIRVFQLNARERCVTRRQFLRQLDRALRTRDAAYLAEATTQGPYRFVAKKFLASSRGRMDMVV